METLSIVPLGVDPDLPVLPLDFRRSWLLPLLEKNLRRAPLAYFTNNLLPLAMKLHRRISTLDPLPRRLYTMLEMHIWKLLPSFMRSCIDFIEAFPGIAPILGSALMERPDLRLVILASLRNALSFAEELDGSVERKAMMTRYAKNFFPILFNLYSMDSATLKASGVDERATRFATLETIRRYVEFVPHELLHQYSEAAVTKLLDEEIDLEKKVLFH